MWCTRLLSESSGHIIVTWCHMIVTWSHDGHMMGLCDILYYYTSNSHECMGVNGEALQLHGVYKKLYFLLLREAGKGTTIWSALQLCNWTTMVGYCCVTISSDLCSLLWGSQHGVFDVRCVPDSHQVSVRQPAPLGGLSQCNPTLQACHKCIVLIQRDI